MKRILSIFTVIVFVIVASSYQIMATTTDDNGSICGHVYYYDSVWGPMILVRFAFLDAEITHDFSNHFGYYELKNLPVDQTYNVTIYSMGLKSETKTVNLTSEVPNQIIDFELIRDSGHSVLYHFFILFFILWNISIQHATI